MNQKSEETQENNKQQVLLRMRKLRARRFSSATKSTIIGIDIGGTLAKMVVFIPEKMKDASYEHITDQIGVLENELELKVRGGTIHFLKFLSSEVQYALELAVENNIMGLGQIVYGTGGGTHKYEHIICSLGLKLCRLDELESLVYGLRSIIKRDDACFVLANTRFGGDVGIDRSKLLTAPTKVSLKRGFIVVNIGSGVSFLHVKDDSFERIGGSSLGGSSFLGLCALLTGVDNFDEAIDLAANGDSAKVDMLVRDIYGNMEKNLYGSLRPTTLAASFGKMLDKQNRKKVRKEDLALSTLIMCSMNVAAMADLHAKQFKATQIMFTGNFLATSSTLRTQKGKMHGDSLHLHAYQTLSLHKRNTISMRVLSYAVSFWSNNKRTAIFLRHEGCLGAIGALIKSGIDISDNNYKARL